MLLDSERRPKAWVLILWQRFACTVTLLTTVVKHDGPPLDTPGAVPVHFN